MYFVEKEINKIVFVIISFILGPIGVDRFIRGQEVGLSKKELDLLKERLTSI
jgi:hypothetical protein